MRFSLSDSLIAKLETLRARYNRWAEEMELINRENAFMLSPGMGYAYYLTADGRVLSDGSDWDGQPVREATDDEAIAAIVFAAKRSGTEDLLKLLPPKPESAVTCPGCHGTRWGAAFTDHLGRPGQLVCPICSGRGWMPGNPGGE
jgi:hypothetical protein